MALERNKILSSCDLNSWSNEEELLYSVGRPGNESKFTYFTVKEVVCWERGEF